MKICFFFEFAYLYARAVPLCTRLGYNPQFMKTIENKSIELKVKTLLDFCDVVDISIYDFFYLGENFNKDDKNILEKFNALSDSNKKVIIELIEKLK